MADVSNREKLFKNKGRNRGVETRMRAKRLDSKKQRDELLLSRRPGVLNELQKSEAETAATKTQGENSNTLSLKQMKRREDLIKWKKQREEKKNQEKSKSKPVFKVGGTNTATTPLPPISVAMMNNFSLTLSRKPIETRLQKSMQMTTRSKTHPTASIGRSVDPPKESSVRHSRKKASVPPDSRAPPAKSGDNHMTKGISQAHNVIERMEDSESSAVLASHTESHMTIVSSDNHMTNDSNSDLLSHVTENPTTAQASDNDLVSPDNHVTGNPINVGASDNDLVSLECHVKGNSDSELPEPDSHVISNLLSVALPDDHVTDNANIESMAPDIHVSYNRTTTLVSPDDHVTDNPASTLVSPGSHMTDHNLAPSNPNDSTPATEKSMDQVNVSSAAWIPGASITAGKSAPNFEEAFSKQCFSPFQFTGKSNIRQKAAFTFRKELSTEMSHPLQSITTAEISDDSIEEMDNEDAPLPVPENEDVPLFVPEHNVEMALPVPENEEMPLLVSEDNAEMSLPIPEDNEGMSLPIPEDNEGMSLPVPEDEEVSLSLQQEVAAVATDDQLISHNGMSDQSIEALNVTVAHNNEYSNQQLLEENIKMSNLTIHSPPPHSSPLPVRSPSNVSDGPTSVDSTERSNIPPPSSQPSQVKDDIRPFRQLHVDITKRLTDLCQEWNGKLQLLEEAEIKPTDEVMDDIRTTVCQAQLLMRQKLKQYLGLVEMAEDPTAEHKTTPEDLQGFWDMLFFQVESIDNKFISFSEMEVNNWLPPAAVKQVSPTKPLRRSKRRASEVAAVKLVASATKDLPSDRLKASRARREAARSKLREMKLAAKSKQLEITGDKEVDPVTKTMKQDESEEQDGATAAAVDEDLISFSPPRQKPPVFKTPKSSSSSSSRKRRSAVKPILLSKAEADEMQGAFMTKLVQVNPSKKKLEKFDTNIIMSPARRSKRLADQRRDLSVDSSDENPLEAESYDLHPNKALFYC